MLTLRKTMKALLLAFAALGLAANAAWASIIIDDYNSGDISVIQSSVGTTTSIQNGITGVLEGRREVTATCTSGCSIVFTAKAQVGSGVGALSLDTGVTGAATYDYTGTGGSGFNLGAGMDFSSASSFLLDVISVNVGGTATVRAYDTDSNDDVTLAIGAPGTLVFGFASFAGVDFSQLTRITLMVSGSTDADISYDNFRAPEPATLILIGGALMGLAAYRRRSR